MFGKLKYTTMNSVLVWLLGVCCFLLLSAITICEAQGLSDYRLCADPKCQTVISMASGKIRYPAGEKGMVSFQINSNIRVKSKSAGKNPQLWGIEVNGREGYAPKDYILEKKIFKKESELLFTVPVVLPSMRKEPTAPVSTPVEVLNPPSNNVNAPKEEVKSAEISTAPVSTPVEVLNPTSNNMNVPKEEVKSAEIPPNDVNVKQQSTAHKIEPVVAKVPPPFVEHDKPKLEKVVENNASPVVDEAITNPNDSLNTDTTKSNTTDKPLTNEKVDNKVDNKEIKVPEAHTQVQDIPQKDIEQSPKRKLLTIETLDASAENDDAEEDDNDDDGEDDEEVENFSAEGKSKTEEIAKKIGGTENETAKLTENVTITNSLPPPSLQPVKPLVQENQNTETPTVANVEQPRLELLVKNNQKAEMPKVSTDVKPPLEPLVMYNQNIETPKVSSDSKTLNGNIETVKVATEKGNGNAETVIVATEKGAETSAVELQTSNDDRIQTEEKASESKGAADIKTEDLKEQQSQSASATNEIKNEQLQNKTATQPFAAAEEQPTHKHIAELNFEATTMPSVVTESGYEHYFDARLEDFETTTKPTIITMQAQATEAQVSVATESTVKNTLDPTVDSVASKEAVPINESTLLGASNTSDDLKLVPNDTQEARSKMPPTTPNSPSTETTAVEEKNEQQNVPSPLPLFQTGDYYNQYHQAQPASYQPHQQNNQHYQEYHHVQDEAEQVNQTTTTVEQTKSTETADVNTAEPTPPIKKQRHDYDDYIPTLKDISDAIMQEAMEEEERKLKTQTSEDMQTENHVAAADADNQHSKYIETDAPKPTDSTATPMPAVEEKGETTSSSAIPAVESDVEQKAKEPGLFATILGTVNNFVTNVKKKYGDEHAAGVHDEELNRILYPDSVKHSSSGGGVVSDAGAAEYCEKLSPNDCPSCAARDPLKAAALTAAQSSAITGGCQWNLQNMSIDMLLNVAGNKMLEMSELLACLATVAVTCLFFLFVYYCFCNSSREVELLAKLNALERSLLATHKENAILKEDLMGTRNKLLCIEDNSFGSNDMVMALKKQLEEEQQAKCALQEQVGHLEKELENAAEAGLELNKIVSELLNNQTGDESIISSVEELQKQLNEQQKTILEINANLAEKSRENSELQLMIAEQNARLSGEIASLQQDNDELELEKSNLQTRLEEVKREFEEDITKALEGKNFEIKRLQSELLDLRAKLEAEHTKYQTSLAKVEALEECLRTLRRDPKVNINQVIDVANVRAELLDMQKRYVTLKERMDTEADAKKLAEEQLQLASSENEKLKHDFHQSEKDKLEAQTRLEVLSNYFKEKETQLQKELSLKEAMWLKQQGEATSTVDRLTTMQEEIQALESQNDSLRAEIEAQLAAHKAQTGTLENRAHETWLAARQSERRYEEARAEATALRRKLTALGVGGGGVGVGGVAVAGEANFEKMAAVELNNAPSPIHMEAPSSPLMGRLPPPPFLPPLPPFMGHGPPPPPPFIAGMPPPPFVPPGEMRPPPLGRLMSPPPGAGSGGSGGSGHIPLRPPPHGRRYAHKRNEYDDDYDDYDDDDYADDDDEDDIDDDDEEDDVDVDDDDDVEEHNERLRQRQRRRGSDLNNSWRRDTSYSPPPRAYRSQSPTDSRYNFTPARHNNTANYDDTETDLEPSPRIHEQRRGVGGGGGGGGAVRRGSSRTSSYRDYSPPPSASSPLNVSSSQSNQLAQRHTRSAFNKSHMSSGSDQSYKATQSQQRHGGKNSGKMAV